MIGPDQNAVIVGRTFFDTLSEKPVLYTVAAVAIVLLIVVGVVAVLVIRAANNAADRAKEEHRSFDGPFGLWKVGNPPELTKEVATAIEKMTAAATALTTIGQQLTSGTLVVEQFRTELETSSRTTRDELKTHFESLITTSRLNLEDLTGFARGAVEIIAAARDIANATTEEELADGEGYLLTALLRKTRDDKSGERRASILRTGDDATGQVMRVARGVPQGLFRRDDGHVFPQQAFDERFEGLCWKAVYECTKAADFIKTRVFHAADVQKHKSFVPSRGNHRFSSILIAPVVIMRDGHRRTLGAVCLDSEKTNHYLEADEHLVAIAALALATAWSKLGNAVGVPTSSPKILPALRQNSGT